jgi:hypothetical protein
MGALELTFNTSQRDACFPSRVATIPPREDSSHMATQYKLNDEYAEHLICTMDLTMAALNEFLQAAGQERTFSFGSSLHFSGRNPQEPTRNDWATKQVLISIKTRLLRRLESAHKAISSFLRYAEPQPSRWYSRAPSPAFTNSTDFAQSVMGSIARNIDFG